MTLKITIKETQIEEVIKITKTIVEFDESYQKDYFENRYKNKNKLIIVAYYKNNPVGYIVGYDKFQDKSFYCWMVAVNPNYRKQGILKSLMKYQENWAKQNNYNKIKIKTRNNRREMLSYLVKYNFYFTEIIFHQNINNNRISLEKNL